MRLSHQAVVRPRILLDGVAPEPLKRSHDPRERHGMLRAGAHHDAQRALAQRQARGAEEGVGGYPRDGVAEHGLQALGRANLDAAHVDHHVRRAQVRTQFLKAGADGADRNGDNHEVGSRGNLRQRGGAHVYGHVRPRIVRAVSNARLLQKSPERPTEAPVPDDADPHSFPHPTPRRHRREHNVRDRGEDRAEARLAQGSDLGRRHPGWGFG